MTKWLTALAVLLASTACGQTVQLFDRDAESWAGHRYGERLPLREGTRLDAILGQRQRLNPAVWSQGSLSNVGLWMAVPSALVVDPTPVWIPQGVLDGLATYSTRFALINAGERINARQAIYLTPTTPGTYTVRYIITARELTAPVHGSFVIVVTAP